MTRTAYSTVIATRNRPAALALSVPLILAQSRLPERVIVIDSSDDPAPNQQLIDRLAQTTAVPLSHQVSRPGTSMQRNIGLAQVETEVVFFPDDDSLVLPGALEAMMRIYDLDAETRVGGVCSAVATAPPAGVLEGHAETYRMSYSDRLRARIALSRLAMEHWLIPDPFFLVADRRYARLPPPPEWLAAENAILVPWMTGFRMSFRTALIRRTGFNEALGRYALNEDFDACFGILQSHLLVGARNAEIYHHKAPERRANGRVMGAMQILNRAYVIARAGETDAAVRAALNRYTRYKILLYAAAAKDAFGRERLAGARAAVRVAPGLLDAAPDQLTTLYLKLRDACFDGEG